MCYFGTNLGPQEITSFARDAHPIHPLGTGQICTIQVKTFWKSLKEYKTYENDILPVHLKVSPTYGQSLEGANERHLCA